MSIMEVPRDAEEPLVPQTQSRRWGPRTIIWDHRILIGIATITFVGILSLGMPSALRQVAMTCPDDDCQHPMAGSYPNSTASSLLLTGPPQLRHMDDPFWQQRQASQLASAWGFLSGRLLFARLAEAGHSVESIVEGGAAPWGKGPPALLVAVLGSSQPQRRVASQPFLSVATPPGLPSTVNMSAAPYPGLSSTVDLRSLLPVAAINTASAGLEAAMGRRLYPFTLEVLTFGGRSIDAARPYAVYELSTGRIVLDSRIVESMSLFPAALSDELATFANSLFSQIARFIAWQDHVSTLDALGGVVAKAAGIAVSVAIGYQVPLWFCVACPAVLGLLAPLVINAGAGAVANAACEHYKLPDADCAELWWSALAVAMILSLASAIPIVFICKLPECARQKQ